jgi:hypothetical protein
MINPDAHAEMENPADFPSSLVVKASVKENWPLKIK